MAGIDLSTYAEAQVLYLTTTGRRSGQPRTIEIWFVMHEGRLYLNAEHGWKTQWVQNIVRQPQVRVQLQERTFTARARVLDPQSDRAVWDTVAEASRRKYGWGDGLPVELDIM